MIIGFLPYHIDMCIHEQHNVASGHTFHISDERKK